MFDYQKVKLVGITQPRIPYFIGLPEPPADSPTTGWGPGRFLTPDEFIAYCARVSNPANQNNTATAQKLVNYLIKNEHWSPFEMVSVTMEIQTTRDIGRQILRHRSFSFQEFSQRYAEVAELIHIREARLQDKKNRQNSIDVEDEELETWWRTTQRIAQLSAIDDYKDALAKGIAKEQARALLPEGLTMSTMYMAGTLRSWLHYIKLRAGNGTQKEHMDIAIKARDVIIQEFPSCKEYLLGTNETL